VNAQSILLTVGVIMSTAATATADYLVVLNKSDHEACLVDPATRKVLTKLPTGQGPHEVAVSPDGRFAYVANYGFFGVFKEGEKPKMDPGNTLTVIDLEAKKVSGLIDLGTFSMPHGLKVSRDGKRLWATCEDSRAVVEVDLAKGEVVRSWDTDQDISHMVVVTPDENKLYVSNIRSGSVTIIDRKTDGVKSIKTGDGAEGIDISPDGTEVWVSNRGANTLSVIAVGSDEIVASFESGGTMPIRARFTPDGREVLVSNARSNTVTVFDAKTRKKLATIEVGVVPVGIEMAPDGKHAYVACTNDDTVKVLDIANRKVAGSFTTGKEPDGMAWAKTAVKK